MMQADSRRLQTEAERLALKCQPRQEHHSGVLRYVSVGFRYSRSGGGGAM